MHFLKTGTNSVFQDTRPDIIPTIPSLPIITTTHLSHENLVGNLGLDSVEIAALYDSSASSSCESLIKITAEEPVISVIESSQSQSQPICCPQSVKSNPSLTSLGFSINESDGETLLEDPTDILPDEVGSEVFNFEDIPKYRRDIYKDCLTLFLENLFGRFVDA